MTCRKTGLMLCPSDHIRHCPDTTGQQHRPHCAECGFDDIFDIFALRLEAALNFENRFAFKKMRLKHSPVAWCHLLQGCGEQFGGVEDHEAIYCRVERPWQTAILEGPLPPLMTSVSGAFRFCEPSPPNRDITPECVYLHSRHFQ
jgi:hypothetical protein